MEILIFDMDGVLLKPQGYHRALQDTVKLAGQELGFGDVTLTVEQIAQFEALGISSEWHSSALCISVLTLNGQTGSSSGSLPLNALFDALAAQPVSIIPRKRGEAAISQLAESTGTLADAALAHIQRSEQIEHSLTMNLFQSMILGDEIFSRMYKKTAKVETQSYLKQYDRPLLSMESTEGLIQWCGRHGNGAAIMTNRPSFGPDNFLGAPDASFGADLVGLTHVPLIGYGETSWLADFTGLPTAEVSKPNPEHALAAILSAAGWKAQDSLVFVSRPAEDWDIADLDHLHDSRITIFEDTPAGVIAVQAAAKLLNQVGLEVTVKEIGIAAEPAKIDALEAVGAKVYPEPNQALTSLNNA